MIEPTSILVCQNRTCRKQGAVAVLEALNAIAPPGISCVRCGCLGKCGNGPNLLILPAQIWYARVRVADVPQILAALTHDNACH